MRVRAAFLIALFPAALFGSYAATELWMPVVGRTTGVGGREFFTTVTVTNTTDRRTDVTLSFFAAQKPGQAPRSVSMQLAAHQVKRHEVEPGVGSLRVTAHVPVIAAARLYSRESVGMVVNGIPVQFAIGSGESTLLHSSSTPYRLYVAETHGFPLYFSVTLDGVKGRRLYVGPHEQRTWNFTEPFAAMRIAGVNGSGKIVAAGQDSGMYEMLLPVRPRHRMPWPEWVAYCIAGVALLVAALRR